MPTSFLFADRLIGSCMWDGEGHLSKLYMGLRQLHKPPYNRWRMLENVASVNRTSVLKIWFAHTALARELNLQCTTFGSKTKSASLTASFTVFSQRHTHYRRNTLKRCDNIISSHHPAEDTFTLICLLLCDNLCDVVMDNWASQKSRTEYLF